MARPTRLPHSPRGAGLPCPLHRVANACPLAWPSTSLAEEDTAGPLLRAWLIGQSIEALIVMALGIAVFGLLMTAISPDRLVAPEIPTPDYPVTPTQKHATPHRDAALPSQY